MTTKETSVREWHGCYDDSWDGLIVDEAFAHPAKFAHGLIRRIYRHGFERGYWTANDLIGDPFSGVCCGGITAAGMGLLYVGVELEIKFVELAKRNIAKWKGVGPTPVIIQGDSREFAKLVGECAAIVTSPPFVDCGMGAATEANARQVITSGTPTHADGAAIGKTAYGETPGQIGALKSGKLDAVITSPPYAESIKGDHGETETAKDSRDKRNTPGGSLGQSQRHGGYGASEGNIGNLKEGKLDAVVTSPPYAETVLNDDQRRAGDFDGCSLSGTAKERGTGYSAGDATPGQIGSEKSDTYWQAMRAVYDQCLAAIKPGGVIAVVIKNYVKGGKRVPLCDDTWTLLQSCGFTPIERIRAMLVKEQTHAGLFGDVTEKTERKSFFRRLAEKKGSPPIDWEEVLWLRKPVGDGGGLDGVVTSPPYAESLHEGQASVNATSKTNVHNWKSWKESDGDGGYGTTPGQIGALKAGKSPGDSD